MSSGKCEWEETREEEEGHTSQSEDKTTRSEPNVDEKDIRFGGGGEYWIVRGPPAYL